MITKRPLSVGSFHPNAFKELKTRSPKSLNGSRDDNIPLTARGWIGNLIQFGHRPNCLKIGIRYNSGMQELAPASSDGRLSDTT